MRFVPLSSALGLVLGAMLLTSCGGGASSEAPNNSFEISALVSDEAVQRGTLPNGVRYAVLQNATPSNVASLRMHFDTGSVNETDATRGLAHFLEHMAFNGSENMAEDEMVKLLERYGLAFGADTNASTNFSDTIYQLELPEASEELLDTTLGIFRETAERLTLDADAIERERGVILAEKRARNSAAFKAQLASLDFLLGPSNLIENLPIGTEETINSVTQADFRRFYDGYYRPDNTFIVLVGDFEPDFAISKIEAAFADWQARGDALADKSLPETVMTEPRFAVYSDPEITTSISLSLVSAPDKLDDSAELRVQDAISGLGNAILNRRLGKLARTEAAQFIGASAGTSRNLFDVANVTSLSVSTEAEKWGGGFTQAHQVLRQALEFGFTQAELDEQIANLRNSLEVSVQTAPTRRTPSLAAQILSAHIGETVFTTPGGTLEQFNANADRLTLEAVETAFRVAWADIEAAPQLYLSTNQDVEDGETRLKSVWENSLDLPVEARAADEAGEFAYTEFGTPGTVTQRSTVEDIEFTTVEFDNGVRLNLKKTPYEKDIIRINAVVGSGSLTFPSGEPGMRTYAGTLLNLSGLEAHKVDDLATILAGKTVNAQLSIGEEISTISGSTTPKDLGLQLDLMTARLIAPTYRPEARAQYEKSVKNFYPTLDSTPGGVAARDVPRLLRNGDTRFGIPSEADLLSVKPNAVLGWADKALSGNVIEIAMVGDVDFDTAIKEVARTFGALPKRKSKLDDIPAALRRLSFPSDRARPVKLSHAGEPDTALLQMYWPAPDGRDIDISRRMSVLVDVFQLELTEVLREAEGDSYSPSASNYAPRLYPDYGYVSAGLEVSPDRIDAVQKLVSDIAARFAKGEFDDDMFDRAINPARERIETSLENNGYWLSVIARAQTDPERLARHRSRSAAYQNMTASDLKPLAKQVFGGSKPYVVHILPEE